MKNVIKKILKILFIAVGAFFLLGAVGLMGVSGGGWILVFILGLLLLIIGIRCFKIEKPTSDLASFKEDTIHNQQKFADPVVSIPSRSFGIQDIDLKYLPNKLLNSNEEKILVLAAEHHISDMAMLFLRESIERSTGQESEKEELDIRFVYRSFNYNLDYLVTCEAEWDELFNISSDRNSKTPRGIFNHVIFYKYHTDCKHEGKAAYWKNKLISDAAGGDLLSQALLCSPRYEKDFPEEAELYHKLYYDDLFRCAEGGDAVALFAVADYIAADSLKEKELLEAILADESKILSMTCYKYAETLSYYNCLDENGHYVNGKGLSYDVNDPKYVEEYKTRFYYYAKGALVNSDPLAKECARMAAVFADDEIIGAEGLNLAASFWQRCIDMGIHSYIDIEIDEHARRELESVRKRLNLS